MDKVFITGASGFIGSNLANALAHTGTPVHVLVRQSSNTNELQHPNITLFTGDILDVASIRKAMQGCTRVYHLAGLAKMWMKDKKAYHYINVTGTDNVLGVARSLGIEKTVVTSTAGVLPPVKDSLTNEFSPKQPALYTKYELTKNEGEKVVVTYAREGLPVVITYPTNVFGEGIINDSNAATMMIRDYINGKWRVIPGDGEGIMNYVYIDDIVMGLILAMQTAPSGSSYILGGENASYNTFFALIKELTGIQRRLYHIPYPIIRRIAWFEDVKTKWTGLKPFITSEWVRKIPHNWSKDISKAKQELSYYPMSLKEGIARTIEWLHQTKQININLTSLIELEGPLT
jgi:nucleoside-diphosphate-sugar epimerase